MRSLPIMLSAFVFGCCPVVAKASPELRPGGIYDYCDLFECAECPGGVCPPDLESVIYCCPPGFTDINDCWEVTDLSWCGPDDYVAICRWGQSNTDGTVTCYDWG